MQRFKKTYMKRAALLVVAIFFLNLVANFLYWYSAIAWFDMVMHTLGGIFLGFSVASLLTGRIEKKRDFTIFFIIVGSVFLIGLGWEGYEYLVQHFIKNVHLADFWDSLSDLYCDVTGGAIATIFVLIDKRRYNSLNDR